MIRSVNRHEIQPLVAAQGAVVAEVLPRAEYEWAHLEGAVHLPLKGWDAEQVQSRLHRDRPIIVYCNDYQ